jgi:hypothetical protein
MAVVWSGRNAGAHEVDVVNSLVGISQLASKRQAYGFQIGLQQAEISRCQGVE